MGHRQNVRLVRSGGFADDRSAFLRRDDQTAVRRLLIAAEGAQEVRLRLNAMVREKCGNAERMPFHWYESAPLLLQKGSAEKLIAMAKQAGASLQAKFGLPLGLVIIDTLGACTGFTQVW